MIFAIFEPFDRKLKRVVENNSARLLSANFFRLTRLRLEKFTVI